MTIQLPFPHHNYQTDPASPNFSLITSQEATAHDNPHPSHVGGISARLAAANVSEIILTHGTFAGNDVLGFLRELARLSPSLADSMRSLGKGLIDRLAGEVGNYTRDFADRLAKLTNPGSTNEGSLEFVKSAGENVETSATEIPVTRFHWSGENHHLGRAGGAIALFDYLTSRRWPKGARVLIWGHSHGGNLIAMMGHLIAANFDTRASFFSATRSHYRNPIFGGLDLPLWERVRQKMLHPDFRDTLPAIDVATFGTPLRYRWNQPLFANLLHFVQHRPQCKEKPSYGTFPKSIQDILMAKGGDYVQQLGICGTDFLHSAIAWRSWNSERRLRRMFEGTVRRRDLLKNLRKGHRVSLDGQTLLVDYPSTRDNWNQILVGHGVYTRHEWLPFHLSAVADQFYG